MTSNDMWILGLAVPFVCSVMLFIFVIPEKRRVWLSAFWKDIHDFCNFKFLITGPLLKFISVLLSFSCIGLGIGITVKASSDLVCLMGWGLMLLGPIAVRLIFESLMMLVLLVENMVKIKEYVSCICKTTEEKRSLALLLGKEEDDEID